VTGARLTASRNRRTKKGSGDHTRRIGAILAGDVERGSMIRGRARKWQPQRNVHGASERRDLDRRHSHVVVRSYHRVELAAHRAHKNRVRGKWSIDSGGARRRRQQRRVFLSESPAIAPVRIQRAKRNPWLRDAEPAAQSFSRNARSFCYRAGSQLPAHLAQRNVGRGENDAELV
jgi:hypothetical protein